MSLRAYLLENGLARSLGDFESVEALDSFCLSHLRAKRLTDFLLDEDFGFDKTASYQLTEQSGATLLLVALEKI
jgi:hypothetical protein